MVKSLPVSADSWVGKIPWRRNWQSIPVFLPGKSHGQRSLVGCSPWGCKESDMTAHTQKQTRKQHGVDTQVHLCPSMSGISAEPILAVNILAHTCSYLIILVTCRSVCMNPDVSHRVHKV